MPGEARFKLLHSVLGSYEGAAKEALEMRQIKYINLKEAVELYFEDEKGTNLGTIQSA